MPHTIRDVARRANVGLGTVSRVLNNSQNVSDATRERVLQAIQELDFSPNPLGRRLSLGKTLTIAAVVPFFTRPAAVERLRGIESALAGSEYDLIVNIETPERRDACLRDLARRERVDGVLIISLPLRGEDIDSFQAAGVPFVLIDINDPSLKAVDCVVVDDVQGGRKATEYLIELGHRHIGYVGDPLDGRFGFTSSRDRYLGYRMALEEAGLRLRDELHKHGQHARYEARLMASEMLALPKPPTAIFAASDTQALGVLEAAREAGLEVPNDLSVIGYDDIEIARYLDLTTVRQLLFESGEIGIQLLLERVKDPLREPTWEIVPTELIIRNSAGPAG